MLKLSHKTVILVAVPILCEAVFLAFFAVVMKKTVTDVDRYNESQKVIGSLDQILNSYLDGAIAVYQYSRSKSESGRDRYLRDVGKADVRLQELKMISADKPELFPRVHDLEATVKEARNTADGLLKAIDQNDDSYERGEPLAALHMRVFVMVAKLKQEIRDIQAYEERNQGDSDAKVMLVKLPPLLLVGFLINLLVAAVLTVAFMLTMSARLRVLMDNTLRFTREAPLNKLLEGDDEIAQIDNVFHQMASALQEAARKERAIVENAIDVICSLDEKLTFYKANPACEAVFGYPSDEMLGMRLVQIVLPEDFEKTTKEFERVKNEQNLPFFENQIRHKDGTIADIRWSVQWSQEERSFYCVASDISARREVERLKQEFISMMSHDLRTPLMSIQASLALLSAGASGQLQPSAVKHVEDAERNINYIISLINSLIDVERIDTAQLQIYASACELNSVMENAVQAVRGLATNKGITLAYNPTDLELEIDSDRIVQVLINLISNALKFSQRGTTITVSAKLMPAADDDASDDVEIRVADQGRGIPEADLPFVFERFKQVEKSDATVKKGSGLGLAICKAIVEAHGGTIGVRSTVGVGSTFWFRVPISGHATISTPGVGIGVRT